MKPKYKGKKTKEGPLFEHKDLFRFTDDEAYSVWKTFKPNWERELSEKEYATIDWEWMLLLSSLTGCDMYFCPKPQTQTKPN
jgi:hypothetical protein